MDPPACGDATARNEGASAAVSGAATGTGAESGKAARRATGAGEGFLAALVSSLHVEHVAPHAALERACALGAYVASCSSPSPLHEDAPAR